MIVGLVLNKILILSVIVVLLLVSTASFNFKAVYATETYSFVSKWGSYGPGSGQFDRPVGIALDNSGNVYVTDLNRHIQVFSSDGTFIRQWGSLGNGDGQFDNPGGIAIDSHGNVYVADRSNNRIQKFSSD